MNIVRIQARFATPTANPAVPISSEQHGLGSEAAGYGGGMASRIAVDIPLLLSYGRDPDFMDVFMWGVAVAILIAAAVWLARRSGAR